MTTHLVKVLARSAPAEGTLALRLERPIGFEYKPGQSIDLTLIEPSETDAKGARRALSLVSAPSDRDLMIATRVRESAFKRLLSAAPVGSYVQVEGPFGSMTLHSNRARPAVLIAGGIGITPFMSILRQSAHDHLGQQFLLIYSNRRPEDAAFLSELQQLQGQLSLQLIGIMTGMDKSTAAWEGRRGKIDAALLKELTMGLASPVFYVAGPPSMNDAVRRALNANGVSDDDIRSEDFSGY